MAVDVDVELCHPPPARVVLRAVVADWGDRLAGAAPLGPEVEQDGRVGFEDVVVERRIGRMDDIAAHAGISPGFKLIGDGRMPDAAQYSARLGAIRAGNRTARGLL